MFGISQGSVAHFTKRFIEAVLDTLQHVIHWPDSERFQQVIEGFAPPEFGQQIPNAVGAVDETHIPIQRPKTQFRQRYINRKGYHSIQYYFNGNRR